jgi:hypothetical protein
MCPCREKGKDGNVRWEPMAVAQVTRRFTTKIDQAEEWEVPASPG